MTKGLLELKVSRWFSTKQSFSRSELQGRVVVLGAFQMLCPACVSHSIPQLKKLYEMFDRSQVAVVGLHTVFEHHEAMQPHALAAFIHEYRLSFPIAVDAPGEIDVPQTMQALGLRGTPSTLIWDSDGQLRFHQFGHVDDLTLGYVIGQLLAMVNTTQSDTGVANKSAICDVTGCVA
jgi:peroxiredoxin